MHKSIFNHFIDDLEVEYEYHPKIFWIVFFIIALLFIIIQSYLAIPRTMGKLIIDSLFPIFIVLSIIFIFLKPKNRNLLLIGILYLILTFLTYHSTLIPKPYGTFFFLVGIWLIVDWYNYKRYRKSIFSQLISGNYYLAFGIFLSTFIFGIITELINLPFLIWNYNIPIPSLASFGIPALVSAFGWTPWVLSILAIFYPFTFKKPKSKNKTKLY